MSAGSFFYFKIMFTPLAYFFVNNVYGYLVVLKAQFIHI